MRKIKQVKKELNTSATGSASSKKSTSQLENTLFELRVDLNYITVRYSSATLPNTALIQ